MQISLDRKRRNGKRNRCYASDSVDLKLLVLIFTRSHRSALLITTPSVVKTTLQLRCLPTRFFVNVSTVVFDVIYSV